MKALRFVPLFCVLVTTGCVAAPFVGAGSAAFGGSISYFRDGDVRYAATIPFATAEAAVKITIDALGFEVVSFNDHPYAEYGFRTWQLRSEQGTAARLVLREVTDVVTVLHIDIDVLGQGADSGSIARLMAGRYEAALARENPTATGTAP